MPNGGLHHCGNCQHLNKETQECSLRNIYIRKTHWTTCQDRNSNSALPHGPVYSIVCEVKNQTGSYCDIPWFEENRVDTVQAPEGGDTVVIVVDNLGQEHQFNSTEAYIKFWENNTSKDI